MYCGEISKLAEDLQVLKPTFIVTVPRVLTKVYEKVMDTAKKRKFAYYLLKIALWFKLKEVKQGIYRKNSIWDYIVLRKIRRLFGGNMEMMFLGSAPTKGEVLEFFRTSLGCLIFEGYGQTEMTCAATCNVIQERDCGQVGPPCRGLKIKLVDVEESQWTAENNMGELCMKGDIVMRGYYNDEQTTREAIDGDGWLHSGDIARWTERGALQIIDRKKHIFKLSQGEYVIPEKIENCLTTHEAISAVFVDGNSLYPYAVALVEPDEHYLARFAEGENLLYENFFKTESKEYRILSEHLLSEIKLLGKNNGLNSFEIPKRLIILHNALTTDNKLLTPTLKLKRSTVRQKFRDQINALYD